MAAITMKELLAGQEKYKQQESQRSSTERISMEQFRQMSGQQIHQSEQVVASTQKLGEVLQDSLVEKTAGTLNDNLAKLTEEIKKAVGKQAVMYKEGAAERIKEEASNAFHKGSGGFVESVKGMGSLGGWFNTEGPSRGLVDDLIRKRAAKKEFISAQRDVTGESKKLLGKRFEKVNELRGQAAKTQEQIAKYKEQGMSDEQIERTGINNRVVRIDQKMAIADPLYRERRLADTVVAAAGVDQKKIATPLEAVTTSMQGLVGSASEENVEEQNRIVGEQTQTLTKIEENTRGLAEGLAAVAASKEVAKPVEKEGGGILGDIAGAAGDLLGKGKRAAKGAARKAGGFGKIAKVGGGLLAAGMGAYTAYEGWSSANEEQEKSNAEIDEAVKSGQITPVEASTIKAKVADETDIKKGSAVGEGSGLIAGAASGAAIGTMIGGPVGTVVGGAVGAFAGSEVGKAVGGKLVSGYKGVKNWFSGDQKQKVEPVQAAPIAPPVQIVDQQQVRGASVSQTLGLTPAGVERATPSVKAPQEADAVYGKSAENKAAEQQPTVVSAPTIVNAPSTNVQQTSQYSVRNPARNSESSQQWYSKTRFA